MSLTRRFYGLFRSLFQSLYVLSRFFFGDYLSNMFANCNVDTTFGIIVGVMLKMKANLYNPVHRVPEPECNPALVEYCRHVRGSHGCRRCGTISLELAKCVPVFQKAGQVRNLTKSHGCCSTLLVNENCTRTGSNGWLLVFAEVFLRVPQKKLHDLVAFSFVKSILG